MTANAELHRRQLDTWDRIAAFWAEHQPEDLAQSWRAALDTLCPIANGTLALDVGTGSGRVARLLAARGATVVAVDASPTFVRIARERSSGLPIEYRVCDATDAASLRALGEGRFDVAVANMVVQNLPALEPLMHGVSALLRPGGVFVFTSHHPCFPAPIRPDAGPDGSRGHLAARADAVAARLARSLPRRIVGLGVVTLRAFNAARGWNYMQPAPYRISAPGQPEPHVNFHRPLAMLLQPAFDAGLMVDGFVELGTADGAPIGRAPAALAVRVRRPGRS